MIKVDGGVCAPKGFKAAGIHCGIRKNKDKKDLALIYSEKIASAASVYTQNLVFGAPITVTKKHLANNKAQAIICNSGNANTCNSDGVYIATESCKILSNELGVSEDDIIIASTGVIGQKLSLEPFQNGMKELVDNLSYDGSSDCCNAIMTTDTVKKEIAFKFMLDGKECHIGGVAKGSGMIHPNMATMLCFITTDVAISESMLQECISSDVVDSFNMVSVDGDTSTNDMMSIMANGMAMNKPITEKGLDYDIFESALKEITTYLAKQMAKDGEGATKLLMCDVLNADNKIDARKVAKSVICSSLLKAAIFGSDANWGRVLCAIGYSGVNVDVNKIDVSFASLKGKIDVCIDGSGIDFSEEVAKEILLCDEITIIVDLKMGDCNATAYGCDLTYEYVKINGDYRS